MTLARKTLGVHDTAAWILARGCLAAGILMSLSSAASAQLSVLSSGDADAKWRQTQIESIDQQLESSDLQRELRAELQAQKRWLENWVPQSLTSKPLWEFESGFGAWVEPVIDPNNAAREVRRRLLGKDAVPKVRDTKALENLLAEKPNDVGVRQLHLHWIDQRQYRKKYADEIAKAAMRLDGMLQQMQPETRQIRIARAFCLYRLGRALVYRGLPDVVAEEPIENPEELESRLQGAYSQLKELVGDESRAEFVLLDVRMLRRDGWFGRALELLESFGGSVDKQWLLKKRRDLLHELNWEVPYREAAALYAKEFPEQAAKEAKAG